MILIDVLGEEDLVDEEKEPTVLVYLIELLDDALWCRRPLLLAGVVRRLHESDFLLLDAELPI